MAFEATLAAHEPGIRLAAGLAVLAGMALWEAGAPRRVRALPRTQRWGANLALAAIDTAVVRVLFPFAGVGMAQIAADRGWGLFNAYESGPLLAAVASIAVLDLAVYLQHVLLHAVPVLWRVHRVHHADPDVDVTTGARFHPLEIALSLLLKFCIIIALGAPAVAVLVFEVILNATAMFNHANVRIPGRVDGIARWLIVTPDMHRIHHSVDRVETDSNFGFNLSVWDRLLGTYRAAPAAGHDRMAVGVAELPDPRACARLSAMLAMPFRATASSRPQARGGTAVAR